MGAVTLYKNFRHALHPLRREWHARVSFPAHVLGIRLLLRVWNKLGRPVPLEVDGLHLNLTPKGVIAETIYREGAFEPHETRLILNLLGAGQTFFDIGANVGYFALAAAKRHPDVHVFAFEPCADTLQTLSRNIKLNGLSNVRAVQTALADYAGEAQIKINAAGKDGLNTLGAPTHPACLVVGQESVPVTTLDEFLLSADVPPPDVMKVDVEGAELLVFRGAQKLLRGPAAPILFYEGSPLATAGFGYEPQEIMRLLRDCGYRLFALSDEDGGLIALDTEEPMSAMTLAVKPERMGAVPALA